MSETDISLADADFVRLVDDLFARRREAPVGDGAVFDPDLWELLRASGLTRLTGTSTYGSGAGWLEAAVLLRGAAQAGASLPLAENDLLGGWLADRAGLPDTEGVRTFGVFGEGRAARGVPWAREASSIVALGSDGTTWYVADLPLASAEITQGANLAAEPRDTVVFADPIRGVEVPRDLLSELELRGALVRAVQICGSLQRSVELAVEYSRQRTQFGRPIANFQAVQRLASDAATETALAVAATDNAVATVANAADWSDPEVVFLVAAAKSTASAAASVASRAVHQIFGAIGTTAEHPLHTLTLPALAWAIEFGTAAHWNRTIAELVASSHEPRDLWEMLSGVSPLRA